MKEYSSALIEEFTWRLKRELTLEEVNFLKWIDFKLRLEKGRNTRKKKKQKR